MPESVHGRNILKMVLESGKSWPREELLAEIAGNFGAEASFHTCSTDGLKADDIIDMFLRKGKLVDQDGSLTADPARMCSHH